MMMMMTQSSIHPLYASRRVVAFLCNRLSERVDADLHSSFVLTCPSGAPFLSFAKYSMADIRRFFGSPKGKGKGKGKREGSDEEGNADPDSRCLRGTKRKIGNGKDHGYGNGKDQQNAPGSSLFGYVEGLDDEAALKEAIERSRVEVEGEVSYDLESPKAELNDVGKGKFAIRSSAQGGIPVFPPAPFSSSATPTSAVPTSPDQTQEFELSDGAFSNDDGTIIDRLEGSLDLVFWKRWIGGMEERRKLMEWMLRELAWHRVSMLSVFGRKMVDKSRLVHTMQASWNLFKARRESVGSLLLVLTAAMC